MLDNAKKNIPKTLDWRSYSQPDVFNGDAINYLSWNKNQHVPYYCGSCWAQGVTSALADRFNVMHIRDQGKFPTSPIALAAQVLVDCSHGQNYGCNGGEPYTAVEYIFDNGIPHVSCMQYTAQNAIAHDQTCTGEYICRDCAPPIPKDIAELYPENCIEPTDYPLYYIDSYGNATNAEDMKAQIYAFGPIGCGIQATDNLEQNYKGGIFQSDLKTYTGSNHEISVVGWGVNDEKVEYWIVRNSWGTYWGDYGFFYLKRSDNPLDNLGVEKDCTWSTASYTKGKLPSTFVTE